MRPEPSRAAAVAGVVGPAAFIGAWVVGAATTDQDYSSVADPISRLAAVGADSRPLMTAGFITFGVAMPIYASSVRRAVTGPAWIAAVVSGLATLGVAATPLDRSGAVDTLHGVLAVSGYVALVALPLLAARPLLDSGHRALGRLAVAAGLVSATSLALTALDVPSGLFQRIGLTTTDVWIGLSATAIAAGRLDSTRVEPRLAAGGHG